MNIEDIEEHIRAEFLQEAAELLEYLEDDFLKFEKDPNNTEIVSNIFRSAHTFKGSGLSAGFDHLGAFAHKFEAVLSKIRDKELEASQEVIDVLLASNDLLKQYIEALQDDHTATVNTDSVAADLESYLDAQNSSSSSSSEATSGGMDFSEGFGFFDDDEPAPAPTDKPDNSIYKILVVDDEEDLRELYISSLEDLGYQFVEADDGINALKVFEQNVSDIKLIISDLKMPNMNGIDFTKAALDINPDIPIIFISGYAEKADVLEFLKMGAYDFLEKPVSPDSILQKSKIALDSSQYRKKVNQIMDSFVNVYVTGSELIYSFDNKKTDTLATVKSNLNRYIDQIINTSNSAINHKLNSNHKE